MKRFRRLFQALMVLALALIILHTISAQISQPEAGHCQSGSKSAGSTGFARGAASGANTAATQLRTAKGAYPDRCAG